MKRVNKKSKLIGWIAVGFSAVVTCIWAFWGIIENFHEGWYYESLFANLGLMFLQYLSPMIIFMAVTIISLYWPRLGSSLHGSIALFVIWFFDAFSNAAIFLLILPLIGLGAMYWFGRLDTKNLAVSIAIGLPMLTLALSGVTPALRVSQRFNDGILQERLVHGNGVELVWAPEGPGWPREGKDWFEARKACENLTEDGLDIAAEHQYIWRLPSVDEAVRSMARHGKNCEGEWNIGITEAIYQTKPDKESPLWNIHSQVIYWWTVTEIDSDRAYMIAYDGKVWPRSKETGIGNLGYRCVKSP